MTRKKKKEKKGVLLYMTQPAIATIILWLDSWRQSPRNQKAMCVSPLHVSERSAASLLLSVSFPLARFRTRLVHCEASKKTKAKKPEKNKNKRGRRAMACSNLYAHGVASCRSRTNEFITTTVPKTIYILFYIFEALYCRVSLWEPPPPHGWVFWPCLPRQGYCV